ncbi:MAG TPA: protease inhibitor I42 family protein [Bryobacteraceae bacterium]
MKLALIVVIGALCILPAHARQPHKSVQADESFDGRKIELHVGETLLVKLPENASTGYRWLIPPESARKLEKILSEEEQPVPGPGNLIGRLGLRNFYFQVLKPGKVELELYYQRPWETAKPPARKFRLHIRIPG